MIVCDISPVIIHDKTFSDFSYYENYDKLTDETMLV